MQYGLLILLLYLSFEASEKMGQVLNEAKVGVAMQPIRTVGQVLPFPKNPHSDEEKACLIHFAAPCSICEYVRLHRANQKRS